MILKWLTHMLHEGLQLQTIHGCTRVFKIIFIIIFFSSMNQHFGGRFARIRLRFQTLCHLKFPVKRRNSKTNTTPEKIVLTPFFICPLNFDHNSSCKMLHEIRLLFLFFSRTSLHFQDWLKFRACQHFSPISQCFFFYAIKTQFSVWGRKKNEFLYYSLLFVSYILFSGRGAWFFFL